MPEHIKEIVIEMLRERRRLGSWENVAGLADESDFDTLFEWLAKEAEKPSIAMTAREAAGKVLKDPNASLDAKAAAASAITQTKPRG